MRSLLLLLQGHAKVKNSESNDGYKKPLFKAVFYVLGGGDGNTLQSYEKLFHKTIKAKKAFKQRFRSI